MSSLSAVRKMTGVLVPARRRLRSTSSPFMPGMRQSSRMTSAPPPLRKYSSAGSPAEKVCTSKPSSTRLRPSDSRNESSSSTRTIRTGGSVGMGPPLGEEGIIASLGRSLGKVMAPDFIVEGTHGLTLQVQIEVNVNFAVVIAVAPDRRRRRLGAAARLAQQFRYRRLIETDQLIRTARRG